jgi:hypothetical protein
MTAALPRVAESGSSKQQVSRAELPECASWDERIPRDLLRACTVRGVQAAPRTGGYGAVGGQPGLAGVISLLSREALAHAARANRLRNPGRSMAPNGQFARTTVGQRKRAG